MPIDEAELKLTPAPPPIPDDRSQLLAMAPGRLWVQDQGPASPDPDSEPALLMLHSLLVTGWDFRRLAAAHVGARRVLCPDLYGCGNSDRPDALDTAGYGFTWHAELLAQMLARLDVEAVDIVGHGYGGSVAVHLARLLEREDARWRGGPRTRLRRLILIAPHLLPVDAPIGLPGPLPGMRRGWSWVGFAPLVFRTVFRRADLRRFLRRSLSLPELLDAEPLREDVDVYWDRLCRDGGLEAIEAMLEQLDELHRFDPGGVREQLHAAARSIAAPTMLVWGDRDAVVPTSLAEPSLALFEAAELRVVEGCGHAPQRERPEALREVIAGFDRRMRD